MKRRFEPTLNPSSGHAFVGVRGGFFVEVFPGLCVLFAEFPFIINGLDVISNYCDL